MAETTLMQEKVFVNPDHSSQVLYQLSELWRDKKLCDATLEVGPVKVYVHRLVLLAACPYLLTIGGQQDVPMLEVRLPLSVGLEGLNVFLTYLYDGVLNLTTNNLLSVEKLSNVMNVAGIQKFCEEFRDMDQSVRDSVGPPEIESFDHNVRLKDNSIQIIFGESQSDLKQDILQENESENDCKRRKMNIETLSPILQQTSSVIRKKRSPNRKIKLKISKSPKGIRSSSTEIKHLESDLNESNVRIKQEPGSYSDDDGDTESFDDPGHTDFVRQAPYSTQALASSDEETETRHSRDITQQQTGQPEVDATRVLQNVVKNMPEVAMGLDTASEIDDDNQPRMFMTLNESSRSPSKKSSKTKHTVSTPSGSSKNKMQLTISMSSDGTAPATFPVYMTCNMSYKADSDPDYSEEASSMTRIKQYREKLKQDPDAWNRYKKKEAERKREARRRMTDEERKRQSELAKLRRKKRLLNLALAGIDARDLLVQQSIAAAKNDENAADILGTPTGSIPPTLTSQNMALAQMLNIPSQNTDLNSSNSDGSITEGLNVTRKEETSVDSQVSSGNRSLNDYTFIENLLKTRQREFWREEKRKYRSRMTDEKRQRIRHQDAQYKRERRFLMKEAALEADGSWVEHETSEVVSFNKPDVGDATSHYTDETETTPHEAEEQWQSQNVDITEEGEQRPVVADIKTEPLWNYEEPPGEHDR